MFVTPLVQFVFFVCMHPTTDEYDEHLLTEVRDGLAFSHSTMGM